MALNRRFVFFGLLTSLVPYSSAASCGTEALPFILEVTAAGLPVLGCAVPSCFVRKAICSSLAADSCEDETEWVGDIELQEESKSLQMHCCTFEKSGTNYDELGTVSLTNGEVFIGGKAHDDKGRRIGFDVISNLQEFTDLAGESVYNVTISRISCSEEPGEKTNRIEFSPRDDIDLIRAPTKLLNPPREGRTRKPNSKAFQAVIQGIPGSDQSPIYPVNRQRVRQDGTYNVYQLGQEQTGLGYVYQEAEPVLGEELVDEVPVENLYCFAADTEVQTIQGPKRMDQLSEGDRIATVSFGGQIFYTPVDLFIHRVPDVVTQFLNISTEDGKQLKISARHLLFVYDCTKHDAKYLNRHLDFADNVRVGDCVLSTNFDTARSSRVKIAAIEQVTEIGAYAPATYEADLIVSGVLASCFAEIQPAIVEIPVAKSILFALYKVRNLFSNFGFHLFAINGLHIDVPFGWTVLSDAAKTFLSSNR